MLQQYTYNLPGQLIHHVSHTLGEVGSRWLDGVPSLVSQLSAEWKLTVSKPFDGGEFNFVAPALRNGNEQVVLKIAPPFENGEYASEAAWLRKLAGKGCVRLLDFDAGSRAMLLERAIPGLSLIRGLEGQPSQMVSDAIEVLRTIQIPAPDDEPDAIVLDHWFSNLTRAAGSDFPATYVERALDYYSDLSRSATPFYLHGDFHPGNIVTATRSPYLAIDPKGIIGPLGYDIAVFLNNLYWAQEDDADQEKILATLAGAVREFSAAFGLPEIDIRRWAFAVQVLGAWWTFDEMPALYSGGVVKADIWDV